MFSSKFHHPYTKTRLKQALFLHARVAGIGPASPVLETGVIATIQHPQNEELLRLFVQCVLFADLTMFFRRQLFFQLFFVARREIIYGLADFAFHLRYVFSCHNILLQFISLIDYREPLSRIELLTSSLPMTCSTN